VKKGILPVDIKSIRMLQMLAPIRRMKLYVSKSVSQQPERFNVDKSTISGIGFAVAGIGVGLYLDGGQVGQLLQPTAALIVFGGTLGAVMVQFPFSVVKQAAEQLKAVFIGRKDPAVQLIEDLTRYSVRARRNGLVSLDSELELIQDPFMKKAMTLAVDGIHSAELRQRMEFEMDSEADREDLIPMVFEAAGGFAPTIGILGAVIGLIQVMQRLQNINEVGRGIAVAFVATIYGVGSANILFLPCAGRMKILMRRKQVLRELMLDGVISIVEKLNSRAFESKLATYLDGAPAAARVAKLAAQ
jgi:chemotaxis protein MotA